MCSRKAWHYAMYDTLPRSDCAQWGLSNRLPGSRTPRRALPRADPDSGCGRYRKGQAIQLRDARSTLIQAPDRSVELCVIRLDGLSVSLAGGQRASWTASEMFPPLHR